LDASGGREKKRGDGGDGTAALKKPHDERIARKSEEKAEPSPQRSKKPHDERIARKSEETAEPSPQRSKKQSRPFGRP